MLHQKPFPYNIPYSAHIIDFESFPLHKHCEVEIIYCIQGELDIDANGRMLSINAGDAIFIGSFTPHSYKSENRSKILAIEFGHALLKDDFVLFSDFSSPYIIHSSSGSEIIKRLECITQLLSESINVSSLDILGNIYLLAASVMREFAQNTDKNRHSYYDRIAPALRLIHENYATPVTISQAAQASSLSEGNFCTLFKNSMGVTFHSYLNSYRIDNAVFLLKQTDYSIEEISSLCGFSDIKTFYRAFKKNIGFPPAAYRRSCRR